MAEIGKDINKAKHLLENGRLVAIPTETVYGLAANALNVLAVTDIFKAKQRPEFDPLIIHVPSLEKAAEYALDIPETARHLAEAFWPGPLTLLLDKKDMIPDLVTAGLLTVGIRCPDHALTRQLLQELPFPLAAPSANPFGYISPTTPKHVQDQLGEQVPYILDGGPCKVGIESTIVGFDNGKGIVLRTGGLRIEEIERVIGKVELRLNRSSNPRAPGQLQSHYSPRKKLVTGDLENLIMNNRLQEVAVLSFQKEYAVRYQQVLSRSGDLDEAARNLFSALRKLDESPAKIILAEYVPETGLGRAINDRLKRATH
jgi:L-threonylcarbamoyladenylate synthase